MRKSLKFAFLRTIPVMCGFLFLGMAFGILLERAGFGFIWALAISLTVYAGSMQFILVPLLAAAAGPLTVAVTTLFVNSRHMFYGLSFLDEFKSMGKAGLYMIFGLTDETYSVLCSCKGIDTPSGTKLEWFLIAVLNQLYWVLGSLLGGIAGGLITLDFTGIDFSMTALFVVILIEQLRSPGGAGRVPAIAGGVAAVLCLLLFGPQTFLLPSLILTVTFLLLRDRLSPKREETQ